MRMFCREILWFNQVAVSRCVWAAWCTCRMFVSKLMSLYIRCQADETQCAVVKVSKEGETSKYRCTKMHRLHDSILHFVLHFFIKCKNAARDSQILSSFLKMDALKNLNQVESVASFLVCCSLRSMWFDMCWYEQGLRLKSHCAYTLVRPSFV